MITTLNARARLRRADRRRPRSRRTAAHHSRGRAGLGRCRPGHCSATSGCSRRSCSSYCRPSGRRAAGPGRRRVTTVARPRPDAPVAIAPSSAARGSPCRRWSTLTGDEGREGLHADCDLVDDTGHGGTIARCPAFPESASRSVLTGAAVPFGLVESELSDGSHTARSCMRCYRLRDPLSRWKERRGTDVAYRGWPAPQIRS